MEDTVLRHNQTRRTSALRKKSAFHVQGNTPSVDDFDKKLSETDCYLQILLNQVAALKVKIDDPEATNEARAKYEEIAEKAIAMTESIKHGIILLQIAKNATLPDGSQSSGGGVGGGAMIKIQPQIQSDNPSMESKGSPVSRPSSKQSSKVSMAAVFTDGGTMIETGIELGAECKEQQNKMKKLPTPSPPSTKTSSPNLKPLKTSAVPEISYSSSEDEDFYDAEDDDDEDEDESITVPDHKKTSPPATLDLARRISSGVNFGTMMIQSPMTPPVEGKDDIDWDALYGSEDEEDVDMKSHGSVITHLLSQVRIGMDLTKIVLPTFILERRSLLEMYSDFFAHPDLFVQTTEGTSQEDRMVRVLKWYLSSFHAGRKSSIAKKPYNPILGETFRCHWKVDEHDASQTDVSDTSQDQHALSNDGPLPWCQPDNLVFLAEQVSHHPPISAFYTEHVKKRISVNAHIYTKSSFLGMSVSC